MATPVWRAGNPYPTGSLVQPLTPIAPVPTALTNPGFDAGNTSGWTFTGAGTTAVTTLNSQAGTYNLALDNGVVEGQNAEFPANPGLSIAASIWVRLSETGTSAGRVRLWWFDAAHAQIGSPVDGNLVQKPGSQSERWVQSSLSAVAPLLTAYVRVGFWSESGVGGGDTRVDSLSWNYTSASAPTGLIFEATQVGLGISAGVEPVWPSSPGIPVNDGTVVWEGIIANRVVWQASPIMVSGATEPPWPTVIGESVTDGTVSWEAVSFQVTDENCPNSKVVTIASSKVYAADEDIVRFSATVNPLDWTTADDAGYLPTGLNQYGSNRTAVLNTYRGNVVSFSASSFGNWQVDPDPANMALLDSMEGIGSTYNQAAHPVANDLFYLTQLGVRTVGIAAGSTNLNAGDAGAPIDPLVQAALLGGEVRPLASYYPGEGQYWLCMRPPLPTVLGPTISGEAPDGMQGDNYAGFAYTVTPGDSPIASVVLSSGAVPTGVSYADAVLGTEVATTPGTFNFSQTVTDTNGLQYTHPDSVFIDAAPIDWLALINNANGLLFGLEGDWSDPAVASPSAETWQVAGWGNGEILLNNRSDNVAWSDDFGATWTVSTLPATVDGNKGYLYYAFGYWWVPSGTLTEVQRGNDVTFTQPVTGNTAARGETIAAVTIAGDDILVMAAPFQSKASRSLDYGASWAFGAGDMKPAAAQALRVGLASNGTRVVVIGTFASGGVGAYSDDGGDTWTDCVTPVLSHAPSFVTYRGGKFIFGDDNGDIYYSTDGETFVAAGATSAGRRCQGIDYDGTRYTAVFSSTPIDGYMCESLDDMATWSPVTPSSGTTQLYSIIAMTP